MTKIIKSEQQWRQELDELAFYVCREKGTERPFSGQYWNSTEAGVYHCIACDAALFDSSSKFSSSCGWPSYSKPIDNETIDEQIDLTHGMQRVEVLCHCCGSHLGHVFTDGPKPSGLRYCINSAALTLKAKK